MSTITLEAPAQHRAAVCWLFALIGVTTLVGDVWGWHAWLDALVLAVPIAVQLGRWAMREPGYVGSVLILGNGERRTITAYEPTTRIISTVAPPWAEAPDQASLFRVGR